MASELDPFDEYGSQEEPANADAKRSRKGKKSAERILSEIKAAERVLDPWNVKADRIDKVYSSLSNLNGLMGGADGNLLDREYNIFWASIEVIKPSVYSRAPVPVVVPRYEDRNPVKRLASELLERCAVAGFDDIDINDVMLNIRDDLVIVARGVDWLSYEDAEESPSGTERVCVEHLDRKDFVHQPARKWAEVEWVGRHAWLSRTEARKRFKATSGNLYQDANYGSHKDQRGEDGVDRTVQKARFTEVWHKTDKRVYWVAEGCEDFLDESEPFLKLKGFFPCPQPAYGTKQRRSLVPVPDISFIQDQLETINELTVRIHDLCDKLVVKGIVPAGTDIGDAVETAYREENASHMLIPVPSMSLNSGAGKLVEWLPIDQVAQTILAAVEARREIIGNVQELFGIADIMRGETEAQETATAQKLKSQYGSVRIRDRVGELVRIARDTVRIMVEIMAEEFEFDTLLKMSQMEIPTRDELKGQLKELEGAAKRELLALAETAEQAIQSPEAQQNPQQAQQQFQQAQNEILGKYGPQIEKLRTTVTQEDIKELLDDQKTFPFSMDIETDSTIYPDEEAEKASRNEFMTAFVTASQALAPLAMSGQAGAKMAGALIKFQLGPYRAGRQLEAIVDEWVESLESMPAPQQGGNETEQALAQSQLQLAQAELLKAQAQGQNYQAQAELKQQQLQMQTAEAATKAQQAQQAFQLEIEKSRGTVEETAARIEKIYAEIQAMGMKASNETRSQDREDIKTSTDIAFRAQDQQRQDVQTATQVENQQFDQQQRLRGEDRSDRQQEFSERQAEVPNAPPKA